MARTIPPPADDVVEFVERLASRPPLDRAVLFPKSLARYGEHTTMIVLAELIVDLRARVAELEAQCREH